MKIRQILAAAAIALPAAAFADPIGFNGAYNYSTWSDTSTYPNPHNTVNTISANQQTLTLFEPDAAAYGAPRAAVSNDFSHVVEASGTLSFNWSFNWNIDACCSGFDFYVGDTLYNLADGYPGNPYNVTTGDASGTFSIAVTAGETITFDAFSADQCCGAANTVISNFNAPASAPDSGSTVVILGAALIGMALVSRRLRPAFGRA